MEEAAITFELEPPSATEMAKRLAAVSRSHAGLVLEGEEHLGIAGRAS
jgi:L-amino acid N-acyltransferase YncA